jgi:hypothetical protein
MRVLRRKLPMKVRWPGVIVVALLVVGTLFLKGRMRQHAAPTTATGMMPSVILVADPTEANNSDDGCAVMFRAVRQAAKRGVAVAEVAPDSNPDLLRRYHVLTVPTVLLLDKTGKEVTRFEGEDAATVKAVQNRLATWSRVGQ